MLGAMLLTVQANAMRERSVRTDNLTMAAARERNVYGRSLNCFQDQPDMYWMTDANLVYPYQECRSAVDCLDYDPCTAEICTGPSHPQPYSCLYTGIAQQFPNGSFSALCCRKSAVTSSAFVAYKSGPISRRLQLLQQSRHSERALPRNTYITYTVSYWNTQITCLRYWTSAHPAWLCDRTKDGCYFTQYTSIGLASGANCAELCTMSSTCINTDEDGNCLYMEYCVAWQWERLVGCLTITNLAFGPGLRIGNSSDYFFLTTPNYEYGMEYPDQNAAVNQILTTACSAEQQARPADPFNYARGTVLTGLLYGSDCNANSQATFGILTKVIENSSYGPLAPKAQYQLGLVLKGLQRYYEAEDAFSKVISTYPNSEWVIPSQFQIAECRSKLSRGAPYDQGSTQEAKQKYEEFIQEYPDAKLSSDAEKNLKRLQEQEAHSNFDIARFYEKQKSDTAAKIYYNEIIAKYPDSVWATQAQERLMIMEKKK